ncbi:hypothetical protein BDBG_04453 [Blastomyces gilchristii SLH14081]|uniref:Uncharacterized protein n=1 Tax=Blastomyces gilchristii (strain SLH14081) TaxID=559298 RepID=A0A179UP97_BLAGS|nr:uncharacterized protein BDBG_04453 [Blastomyces gilchristii SLH14081]OAT08851.1 hypothetical protein BDBG_04453 [Blastomyces gilchristii SLH14081]
MSSSPSPRPPSLSPCVLVARFLRSNNYEQTLAAFLEETGLPPDLGLSALEPRSEDWTIEKILEEKMVFDKSLEFERTAHEEGQDGWSIPAPSTPNIIETPSKSNLVTVTVQPYIKSSEDGHPEESSVIIASGADKRVSLYEVDAPYSVISTFKDLVDSPLLSGTCLYDGAYRATTTMSGQLLLFQGQKIIASRKDHTKCAVAVVAFQEEQPIFQTTWLATAGWDSRIYIYRITIPDVGAQLTIGEPLAVIKTATVPECILFMRSQGTGDLVLLASVADSTYLYYYLVESPLNRLERGHRTINNQPHECPLLGKQDLSPHSNAWVAFSPACFALSPRDPTLLAVATSSQPYMKLIFVRILMPSASPSTPPERRQSSGQRVTQALRAMADLGIHNREDAAILAQVNTMAPQTAYSTPQVVWRPDGSGVWVNGEDGVIRGIDARTGKLVVSLTGGHEPYTKVRSIWAGWVRLNDGENEERLVSGGFDKKLIMWTPERR